MNDAESQWKVKEAAKFLSCSTSWIYKAAAKGLIPCIRIGAMLRFDPEQLRAFARGRMRWRLLSQRQVRRLQETR